MHKSDGEWYSETKLIGNKSQVTEVIWCSSVESSDNLLFKCGEQVIVSSKINNDMNLCVEAGDVGTIIEMRDPTDQPEDFPFMLVNLHESEVRIWLSLEDVDGSSEKFGKIHEWRPPSVH